MFEFLVHHRGAEIADFVPYSPLRVLGASAVNYPDPLLVFDHVVFELVSVYLPSLTIKGAAGPHTVDSRIGHVQRMVRIIVGEKPLATERQQSIDLIKPLD
jgi:hypothetical protein